jgi:hypothetical protein
MESSSESDHKNENQPVRHTQRLKIFPYVIVGKAGPFPIIQVYIYFSIVIAFQPEVLHRIM